MKLKQLTLLTLMMTVLSNLSFGQEIKFTIKDFPDTTVNLIKYFGEKMYYADTTVSKNGVIQFDGSKHPTGMYALFLPGQQMLDFVHDNEKVDFYIEDQKNVQTSASVRKSKNNQTFYSYVNFMTEKMGERNSINKKIKSATAEEKKALTDKNYAINTEVQDYQKDLVAQNQGTFLGDLINMNIEVKIPEAPKDENGALLDSNWAYNYFINHFWENTNLKNDEIVRTPTFHKKLKTFFSKKILLQVPDTLIKYADKLVSETIDTGLVFQFVVTQVTSLSGRSDIMGMENVYVYMVDNYYCNPGESKATWADEESLKKICEQANKLRPTLIGKTAPRIILPDSTEKNWIDFYELDAEYKVLYFWEATCGHCKKTTPKLQKLYAEKMKKRGVEVYAVGKAMEADFELWKKFIKKNELTFTNVGLTKTVYKEVKADPQGFMNKNQGITTIQSINYQATYDIFSTPRIFVLDKNNKILFKRISISQLEEILDRLQGVPDAEKLFPIEEEDPEERENASSKS